MAIPSDHKGWAKPMPSPRCKFHWFNSKQVSLCKRYSILFANADTFDTKDMGATSDQCETCWKKYKKMKEAKT